MYKKYSYTTDSGTQALVKALLILNSRTVIIPTYTCEDILRAVKLAKCKFIIVDCGLDLQIDPEEVLKYSNKADTIIVPHMFGIRANVKTIKENTDLKIIEDLSQCHGLADLGALSDVVVTSTNKSKWIDEKGGGYLFYDGILDLPTGDFDKYKDLIATNLTKRKEIAQEYLNAGVPVIGSDNAFLRAMYFTDSPKRTPYIPLHIIEKKVGCYKVNSYFNKIDWISIKV